MFVDRAYGVLFDLRCKVNGDCDPIKCYFYDWLIRLIQHLNIFFDSKPDQPHGILCGTKPKLVHTHGKHSNVFLSFCLFVDMPIARLCTRFMNEFESNHNIWFDFLLFYDYCRVLNPLCEQIVGIFYSIQFRFFERNDSSSAQMSAKNIIFKRNEMDFITWNVFFFFFIFLSPSLPFICIW